MSISQKILLGIKSISYMFLFYLFNIFRRKQHENIKPNVIVSLTCFPGRIGTVYLTVESILFQKYKCYTVVLYLSKQEFPDGLSNIPNTLMRLRKRGLIIKFVEDNLRSYKKLNYALIDYPNMPILTADDDILYPFYWLSKFADYHSSYPDDILFARGHKIVIDILTKKISSYDQFTEPQGSTSSLLYIPTGVSGVLYPPNCFYKDVRRSDIFMSITPNADDIWYKVMTYLNGRESRLIFDKSTHFTPVLGTQKISLRKKNLSDSGVNNNAQLKKIIEYYSIKFDAVDK